MFPKHSSSFSLSIHWLLWFPEVWGQSRMLPQMLLLVVGEQPPPPQKKIAWKRIKMGNEQKLSSCTHINYRRDSNPMCPVDEFSEAIFSLARIGQLLGIKGVIGKHPEASGVLEGHSFNSPLFGLCLEGLSLILSGINHSLSYLCRTSKRRWCLAPLAPFHLATSCS